MIATLINGQRTTDNGQLAKPTPIDTPVTCERLFPFQFPLHQHPYIRIERNTPWPLLGCNAEVLLGLVQDYLLDLQGRSVHSDADLERQAIRLSRLRLGKVQLDALRRAVVDPRPCYDPRRVPRRPLVEEPCEVLAGNLLHHGA